MGLFNMTIIIVDFGVLKLRYQCSSISIKK